MIPASASAPVQVMLVAPRVDDRRRLFDVLDVIRGVEVVGGAFNTVSATACLASHAAEVVVVTHDVAWPTDLHTSQTGQPIPVVAIDLASTDDEGLRHRLAQAVDAVKRSATASPTEPP
jgi:hypothetical protein